MGPRLPLAYVVRQFQARFAKAMEILEAGIDDVLSYLHYPQPHRVRISSTNPLERLNLEIRRTRVVGIFPNVAACLRLIGMLLVEKNDDRLTDDKAYLTFDDARRNEWRRCTIKIVRHRPPGLVKLTCRRSGRRDSTRRRTASCRL